MTKRTFKDCLALGERGERTFLHYNKTYEKIKKNYQADFRCRETGLLVEMKTDYYSMKKTANFFMETFSNIKTKRRGGPFSALDLGVDYFVYYFITEGEAFWFHTKELVEYLDANRDEWRTSTVYGGKNIITEGLLVPRTDLTDILAGTDNWKEPEHDKEEEHIDVFSERVDTSASSGESSEGS